jgi:aspartyl protease family protein
VAAALAGAAVAAADSPEEVLKSRGLKRVGTTYVLAGEADVQKNVGTLKTLSNQLVQAARQQAGSEQQAASEKGMMRQLLAQRVALGQQLTAFEQEMRNIGGAPPLMAARRNEMVIAYNNLGDQIRLLQDGQGADPKLQDRLLAEVSRRRETYIQAVLELRQLVDTVTKSYADVANDPAVKQAIETLARSAKSAPRLGPSAPFAANVKLLERIERSVITDAVDLRKSGGVFWVDATFNGKVIRPMVFDTGASLTTIPAGLADELGLKPSPSDPVVRCETADGTVVEAKRMTVPTMRVGRFVVNDVDCAVMPTGKGEVAPLLGQSFHRHFTYKFTPESGHLVMSRVEGLEPAPQPARPARGTAKAKSRAGRSRAAAAKTSPDDGPDGSRPD